MFRTLTAFRRFLLSNNLPTEGVSLTIEFDHPDNAYRAVHAMKREFSPAVYDVDLARQPAHSTRILDIPVKFVARIS